MQQIATGQPDMVAMMISSGVGLVFFVLMIFMFVCMWRMFTKAGQPGWAVLIPVYNIYIMLKIAGRPVWWMIFFFVPLANFITCIVINLDIAKNFGKSTLFGIALIVVPFIALPMLAFGDATYVGPRATA